MTTHKRSSLKRRRVRLATRSSPASKRQRNVVPDWAPYIYGENYAEKFLADKRTRAVEWVRFKDACRRACAARATAKLAGRSTPARAKQLRSGGGLAAFCRRKRGDGRPRSLAGSDTFAARVRQQNPELAALSPTSHTLAIKRARKKQKSFETRAYSHHTTSVACSELNTTLLRDWYDLDIDSTPHITSRILEQLESSHDAQLTWRYWKRHDMGRLFADPWESLASLNRLARAVLCFSTGILDLDMSCCHHRIALALGERYGVSELEPLRTYVADPKAWRTQLADDARVSMRDAKLAGVILLNTGGLSTWINACEYTVQLDERLRADLKALQSCCERIRDAVLAHERDAFPAELMSENARTRWSYVLCEREDRALRAIWRAVAAKGARVVQLVYDGLMLLPGRARRSVLERAATRAATDALGCDMPCVFKEMKLPKPLRVIMRKDAEIAKLKKLLKGKNATIRSLREMR